MLIHDPTIQSQLTDSLETLSKPRIVNRAEVKLGKINVTLGNFQ